MQKIIYPNLESALRPVSYDVSLPVPIHPGEINQSLISTIDSLLEETKQKSVDYKQKLNSDSLKFNQIELNDFIKYLCFPMIKAELLVSRLTEKNNLESTAKISNFSKEKQ